MMRIWIDTEFNGFKGELISIALVAENGDGFYQIVTLPQSIDPWVAEHVVPVLNSEFAPPRTARPVNEVRKLLQRFLMGYEAVHIIADWPEDIAHFCRLLLTDKPGERINTPPLTMEIVRFDAPSKVPHNALEDARGMRDFMTINASEQEPAT